MRCLACQQQHLQLQQRRRAAFPAAAAAPPAVRGTHPRAALRGTHPPRRRAAVVVAAAAAAAAAQQQQQQQVVFAYAHIEVQTRGPGVSVYNITPQVRAAVEAQGVVEGHVTVLSRHTTTAVAINEDEPRLLDDIRQFLTQLVPAARPYLHNDVHLREAPPGWPGGHASWVAQEPVNTHSHLLSICLGNSETVPVTKGKLALGTWQSLLLIELDGAPGVAGTRTRTVGVQVAGVAQPQQQPQQQQEREAQQ